MFAADSCSPMAYQIRLVYGPAIYFGHASYSMQLAVKDEAVPHVCCAA